MKSMYEDPISIKRIKMLHPSLRSEAMDLFLKINREVLTGNAKMRVTCTHRSLSEQRALYDMGRSKSGKIVTNARAGYSYHNYGLALDWCLIVNDKYASWDMLGDYDGDKKADWMEVVFAFKNSGWEWAGDWKGFREYCHFQKTFGNTIKDLLELEKDAAGYPII